jgi:hypothetical protein
MIFFEPGSGQAKRYKLKWLKRKVAYKRVYIRIFRVKKSDIEILEHETEFLTRKCTGLDR